MVGDTVRFGYFSQDSMPVDTQKRVIDLVRERAEYVDLGGGRHLSAMQFLQHFMFTPEQQQNYVYKLSGGEQRRLQLCLVLMQSPNFLVLDEPTNDLDILSLQILEEYLQDFSGCVIVVSHDRYFMDKVVDHLLVFKGDGEIQDFPGNYSQFREWQRLQPRPQESATPSPKAANPRPRVEQPKKRLNYNERREFEKLGQEIEQLEAEKKDIVEALSGATLSVEEITEKSKRLPQLEAELDEKSMRWLELSEWA